MRELLSNPLLSVGFGFVLAVAQQWWAHRRHRDLEAGRAEARAEQDRELLDELRQLMADVRERLAELEGIVSALVDEHRRSGYGRGRTRG